MHLPLYSTLTTLSFLSASLYFHIGFIATIFFDREIVARFLSKAACIRKYALKSIEAMYALRRNP
ncbi:hypothetical protein BZL35_00574 [Candidatus Pandoraea novymonadis]|uniref:Uncharacterized protein n=1 Tax=Candidatus Pandoraea novymonadis TaxID=1808959 RepID=A0ABX5FF54_9BURK|nr:hypothetical protein BZL35_00574 [Candidatus Pandoraea novymonadis]